MNSSRVSTRWSFGLNLSDAPLKRGVAIIYPYRFKPVLENLQMIFACCSFVAVDS
ncbi:hypothetical protein ACT4WO_20090 (plasmid) [Acinetobacter baumannii]